MANKGFDRIVATTVWPIGTPQYNASLTGYLAVLSDTLYAFPDRFYTSTVKPDGAAGWPVIATVKPEGATG